MNLNEIALSYQDYGEGQPILFINGWLLTKESWEQQIHYFVNNGYRVITYDKRGCGESDKPMEGYDFNTLAHDLEYLINSLDLSNVILVGFSMGSGEAIRYITNYGSSKIHKLILIGGILPSLIKSPENPNGYTDIDVNEMLSTIEKDRAHFTLNFLKTVFGYSKLQDLPSDAFIDWQFNLAMKCTMNAALGMCNAFMTTDFSTEIDQVEIPVLLLHGDHDKNVNIETTSQIASELFPHSEFIMYQSAPHALFYTHHTEVNEDILNFIKD